MLETICLVVVVNETDDMFDAFRVMQIIESMIFSMD